MRGLGGDGVPLQVLLRAGLLQDGSPRQPYTLSVLPAALWPSEGPAAGGWGWGVEGRMEGWNMGGGERYLGESHIP